MAIAREIVVGDEEPPVALPVVFPNRVLDIVGRAKPALAALYVDDRAGPRFRQSDRWMRKGSVASSFASRAKTGA